MFLLSLAHKRFSFFNIFMNYFFIQGAGRVAFSNPHSYLKAVSSRFVQIQHVDIDKRVEIKPYVLDAQMCDMCRGMRCLGLPAPYFCGHVTCLQVKFCFDFKFYDTDNGKFQYFCEHCWPMWHSRDGLHFHKPLIKDAADRPRFAANRY